MTNETKVKVALGVLSLAVTIGAFFVDWNAAVVAMMLLFAHNLENHV